ncbi:MAG TPA: LysR family transcriptional regulator [Acidimicrobiia bacterium]|nr:LysR family transcriptional regulator [Acidimicrobiia bacterium]
MLDIKRLRFLREVAERGTITAAAEALAYTPSAISQQIAILEGEVGTALLERQGRNVALTPAGRVLVEHAPAVFDAIERATNAVSDASGDAAGRVMVGALPSVMASLIPETLGTLSAEHPAVSLHLVELNHDDAARELRLGALDVAVDQRYKHVPHSRHEGLSKTKILEEALFLAVPAGSSVRKLAEASSHPWVAAPLETSECGRAVRAICRSAGFEPRVQYEIDDFEVTLQLVASVDACAILPALALRRLPDRIRLIPLGGPTRQILAVTRPAGRHRPAVRAFLDHLTRAAHSQSPSLGLPAA